MNDINLIYLNGLNLLNGDLYFDDIELDTKHAVIKKLKEVLSTKQANELYDELPIQEWVDNKFWLTEKEIINKIEEVIIEKRFKLKYFQEATLDTIKSEYDYAISPKRKDDIPFPYFSLDDENYIQIFLATISTTIAQHVYGKWATANKKTLNIKQENMFIIPSWFGGILPLFSGVGNNKFYYDCGLNGITYDELKKSFNCEIKIDKIIYCVRIKKADLINYKFIKKSKTIDEDKDINETKKKLLRLLDKSFSSKGLLLLLTIFLFIEKNGRTNIVETTINKVFRETISKKSQLKERNLKEYIDLICAFSIFKISRIIENKIPREVSFLESTEIIPSRSVRTYRIKIHISRIYHRTKEGYDCYILPDNICKENIKQYRLKFFLLIFIIKQLIDSKALEIDYKIYELIKFARLDDYGLGGISNTKQLNLIINTISYMKKNGYIGDWYTYLKNKENRIIHFKQSKKDEWKDYSIVISHPDWFTKYAVVDYEKDYRIVKKKQEIIKYTGSDLKAFRKEVKMTQEELASLLKVSRNWLSKLENNKEMITRETQNTFHRIIQANSKI